MAAAGTQVYRSELLDSSRPKANRSRQGSYGGNPTKNWKAGIELAFDHVGEVEHNLATPKFVFQIQLEEGLKNSVGQQAHQPEVQYGGCVVPVNMIRVPVGN